MFQIFHQADLAVAVGVDLGHPEAQVVFGLAFVIFPFGALQRLAGGDAGRAEAVFVVLGDLVGLGLLRVQEGQG